MCISWVCTVRKSFILFVDYHCGLVSSDFIHFGAHSVPDSASGRSFWLTPLSSYVSSSLFENFFFFLTLLGSSSCTFLVRARELDIFLRVQLHWCYPLQLPSSRYSPLPQALHALLQEGNWVPSAVNQTPAVWSEFSHLWVAGLWTSPLHALSLTSSSKKWE